MRRWITHWAAIGLCVLGSERAHAETLTGMITDKPSETTGGLDYPTQYSLRPLTLTRGLVSVALTYQHAGFDGRANEFVRASVEAGITDDITVDATPFAYSLGDEVLPSGYGIGTLGATFRLLSAENIDVGLRARVGVSNPTEVGLLHVAAGIPVRFRSDLISISTGISVSLLDLLGNNGGPEIGLMSLPANFATLEPGLPVAADLSFSPNFFAGVRSGFGLTDLTSDSPVFLPVGLQAGGSFDPGGSTLIDVVGGFGFPYFYYREGINPDLYVADISAKLHFQAF